MCLVIASLCWSDEDKSVTETTQTNRTMHYVRVFCRDDKVKLTICVGRVADDSDDVHIVFVNDGDKTTGGGKCILAIAKDNKTASKNVVQNTCEIPRLGPGEMVLTNMTRWRDFERELRARESILAQSRDLTATLTGVVVSPK